MKPAISRVSASRVSAPRGDAASGSSREAAVYALYEAGIRCVIAPSFGDIFAENAVKNGLLAAIFSENQVIELSAAISAEPARPLTVDLVQHQGSDLAIGVDARPAQLEHALGGPRPG